VTSLRIFPRRSHPPTISFDYSVSTLTRTFRIGKKKNKIISARSSMRERESCASSLRIGFLLAMASMRSRNLSLFYHLNARLRITNSWKKQAHSLRSHCDFFPFFLLFLRTRANVLYAAHSTIIRQRQRLFGRAIVASHFTHPSVWKLSCKRWVDGKRGEWSRVDCVHAREDCHRVNEECEAKFVIGFEKGKKLWTRVKRGEEEGEKGFLFRSLTGHSLCHKV